MCTERGPERAGRQRGFTLIELVVFVVIVSVGLAGVLTALNVTTLRSADPVVNKQMLAVAESLMEEIQAKDFSDAIRIGREPCFAGAATQANRPNFDCVINYDGFPSGARGIFQSDGATPAPGLGDYTATVRVAPPAAGIGGVPPADIWQITVTVTRGTDNLILTGFRFNYGQQS